LQLEQENTILEDILGSLKIEDIFDPILQELN
jgi:hypothetical protein